jgi:chromate transporter
MCKEKISLFEIAKTFLTIGTIGFGGGLAIIALMQEYCVNKKKWLEVEEFSHGIALGQFLGTFAVNASIFIGYRLRGFIGGIVSVISFLLPSIVFIIIISALYQHYNKIPALQSALKGITPVVIALILSAAFQIGKNKINSRESVFILLITIFLVAILKLQIITILLAALIYGFLKVRFFETELNK